MQGPTMRPSNNQENKRFSDISWRVQLLYIKVQAPWFLEPPLQHNQDQTPLMNHSLVMAFLTILGVTEILCSFRLALEGETGKGIPKAWRSEFLERFLASNFDYQIGSFKNSFAAITSLPEVYLGFRRFILLVQTKKWFLWTMAIAFSEGYIH